jgi:hypothetical protein
MDGGITSIRIISMKENFKNATSETENGSISW